MTTEHKSERFINLKGEFVKVTALVINNSGDLVVEKDYLPSDTIKVECHKLLVTHRVTCSAEHMEKHGLENDGSGTCSVTVTYEVAYEDGKESKGEKRKVPVTYDPKCPGNCIFSCVVTYNAMSGSHTMDFECAS